MDTLELDQLDEPLLSIKNFRRSNPRWKREIVLLIISFALAICLTFYLYLNIQIYNTNDAGQATLKPLSRRKPVLDHESMYENSGPSLISIDDLLAHCLAGLRAAGKEVVKLSLLHNEKLSNVGSKGQTREGVDDIVTEVDIRSNRIITGMIKDSYRRLKLVSEEDKTHQFDDTLSRDSLLPIDRLEFANSLRVSKQEIEDDIHKNNLLLPQDELLVWIDPLDATKEYSENLTHFVTLMACIVHKQTPIAGIIHKPFTHETYWSLNSKNVGYPRLSADLLAVALNRKPQTVGSLNIIVSRSHAGDVEKVLSNFLDSEINIIQAGGSGYKTIELLKGNVDAYVHKTHIKKWDICAPYNLISSFEGGKMTSLRGSLINFGTASDYVVTDGLIGALNNTIQESLVKNFKDHPSK